IPMDPIGVDWNELAKKSMGVLSFFTLHDVWIIRLINIVFFAGWIISFISLLISPIIINFVIFGAYLVMTILQSLGVRLHAKGLVYDTNGKPLSFAIIRIFNAELHNEVAHKVADIRGNYYALVGKGSYYITIDRKNSDETYTH